jgi:hypothetical protein
MFLLKTTALVRQPHHRGPSQQKRPIRPLTEVLQRESSHTFASFRLLFAGVDSFVQRACRFPTT